MPEPAELHACAFVAAIIYIVTVAVYGSALLKLYCVDLVFVCTSVPVFTAF